MREEDIDYIEDLPIDIYLVEVENYPLHWHDATEIVFVLRGSIDIEIGTDVYHIEKDEMEIVNHNEVHSLKSDEENLILIINIDPDFFEKYYQGAREVFFYADSSDRDIQEADRYVELRRYISILFYEVISKYEDSKDIIEEKLLGMMYHLLNNFHYLFYEEESLRDDELELERYHRIVRYISNNYMDRVSLQEIADKEFLTSQYLSFKIKNTFGYGFNDFLNLTRVEESIKLLLNTDKNISEISEEIGFSHVRYYNKHFRMHYDMSPMEYREKFKVSDEELENLTLLKNRDLKEALPYLKNYLETYERYEYDDRINKYDIDILKEAVSEFQYPKIINLGSASELLYIDNEDLIFDVIDKFGFEYGLIEDLDNIIDRQEDIDSINWHHLESLIDFVFSLNLKVIFIRDGYEDLLDAFKDYISIYRKDLDIRDIEFIDRASVSLDRVKKYKYNRKDTLYAVGDIFVESIENHEKIPSLMDGYSKEIGESDTFFSKPGLITMNGLKKPSYYAYSFMDYLGGEVLYKDEGFLVTRSRNGFQILLFDPLRDEEEKKSHIGQKKRYSLNISNMNEDYRVIKYELSKDSGSVYDKWDYLGRPKIINKNYMELLKESTIPEIKFYYAKKQTVYNIVTTVKDRGANLYIFEKVQ